MEFGPIAGRARMLMQPGRAGLTVDAPDPLQVLTRERARLAAMLETDPNWQALKHLASKEARGDWADAAERGAERARFESALGVNTVYLAWQKLGEVVSLLEPATPASLIAPEPVVLPVTKPETNPGAPAKLAAVREAEHAPDPGELVSPLLRIRGMDEATARSLESAGVTTLARIAGLTASDVKHLRRELGLGRRLSQQGWIEQAALLVARDVARAATKLVTAGEPIARTAVAEADAGAQETLTEARTAAVPSLLSTPPAAALPAPTDAPEIPTALAPLSETTRVAAPAPRPGSLTERLFARTPIASPQRSLLAAIEAAEQARLRPARPLLPDLPVIFDDPPAETEPAAERAKLAARIEATRPAITASEDWDAGAETEPLPPMRERSGGSKRHSAPLSRPVVAAIEEEAEVAIVQRKGGTGRKPSGPERSRDAILPVDHEAQGGEDFDPRALAAHRGAVEEASVEIVVRRSPAALAAAAASETEGDANRDRTGCD
jgi:predicted flap endonuclease-1-like 5' DNA nuclease